MVNSNHAYEIIISEIASQMLISHVRFFAQVNQEAAVKLVNEFQMQSKSISSMPEKNPYLENDYILKRKYRRIIFQKRYLIIYQIRKNKVYMDYVVDCSQDYQWLL